MGGPGGGGGLEFGLSFLAIPSGVRPILILPSVGMRRWPRWVLSGCSPHPKGFARGGIFWLTILLGLAMTDTLTRAVYSVIR